MCPFDQALEFRSRWLCPRCCRRCWCTASSGSACRRRRCRRFRFRPWATCLNFPPSGIPSWPWLGYFRSSDAAKGQPMGTRCTEMLTRRFLVSSLLDRKTKTNAWRPKHADQRSLTDLAATSLIHGIPDFFFRENIVDVAEVNRWCCCLEQWTAKA